MSRPWVFQVQFLQPLRHHPTFSTRPFHSSMDRSRTVQARIPEMGPLGISNSVLKLLTSHRSRVDQLRSGIYMLLREFTMPSNRSVVIQFYQKTNLFAATWLPTSLETRSPKPRPLRNSSPIVS